MKTATFLIIVLFSSVTVTAEETGHKYTAYIASVNEEGIQRVEIRGGEYFYNPDYIIVRKGIPVEFIIRRDPGIVPHNIVIDSPEAGMEIRESMSTEEKIIRFIPEKAGIYSFYCDRKLLFFKSHREKGMEGVIEVRN